MTSIIIDCAVVLINSAKVLFSFKKIYYILIIINYYLNIKKGGGGGGVIPPEFKKEICKITVQLFTLTINKNKNKK